MKLNETFLDLLISFGVAIVGIAILTGIGFLLNGFDWWK